MASEGAVSTETGKVFSEPTNDGCPSVNRVTTSTSDFDEWGVADLSASMAALSDQITVDGPFAPSSDLRVPLLASEPLRARGVEGGLNAAAAVGAAEMGRGGSDAAGRPKGEDVHQSVSDMPSGNTVDANVSAPTKRPVRVRSPKKTLFGKFLKKKPSKANVQVPDFDVCVPTTPGSLPGASRDIYSVPSAGGGLDVGVAVPSADIDASAPFASSAGMSGGLDVPSVGADISGDLPSVDSKLTGQGVHVVGGDVSRGAGLAAGATTAVSATAVGHGLSGTAKKQEGELPRVPDAHPSVPDMPRSGIKVNASASAPAKQPVGAMAPRKSMFGKFLVKKPTDANVEANIEVPDVCGDAATQSKSLAGKLHSPFKANVEAPEMAPETQSKSLAGKLHTPFKANVEAPEMAPETQSKSLVGKLHTSFKASVGAPGMTPGDGATHTNSLVDQTIKKEPSKGSSVETADKPSGSVDASGSAPGGKLPAGAGTRKKTLFGKFLKKAPSKH